MTRHRDLDSLELAFVATLHEILPTARVSLFRVTRFDDQLEMIISLEGSESSSREVAVSSNSRLVTIDAEMIAAIRELRVLVRTVDDQHREWMLPVARGDKAQRALVLLGHPSLDAHRPLVEGFARIYSNYMSILHEAEHDKLTGLLNRRTLETKLVRMLKNHYQQSPPGGQAAWLAVVDVDRFKRINDSYGHVYGDEILLLLAQQMQGYFSDENLLFRVGGEEFVITLAPQAESDAVDQMDAFRQKVAERDFPQGLKVTLSIGLAQIRDRDYPRHIFDLADKALYYAKENGRDQVWAYERLVREGRLVQEQEAGGSIELF